MTWHRPFGTTSRDGWDVVIEPDASGWEHTGLYAAELAPSASLALAFAGREGIVVPLSGSVTITSEDSTGRHEATLAGRPSVFAGATDVAYLPGGSTFSIAAEGGPARVAVAFAVTGKSAETRSFRHVGVDEVPVELRGAGSASREVRNFGIPGVLDADSIIACEVITPAGNWSSYPPHKHDEERPGEETQLEEIYYFECQSTERSELDWHSEEQRAGGARSTSASTERSELDWHSEEQRAGGARSTSASIERSELDRHSEEQSAAGGLGYVRVYGTEDRPIDVLAEVRSGDVVLVPHGWHGPAMAPPGYDLYYLNVMAGPGPERAWRICDDPAHAWVRDSWPDQQVDPRLPFGGHQ